MRRKLSLCAAALLVSACGSDAPKKTVAFTAVIDQTGPTAVDRYLPAGTTGLNMNQVLNMRIALLHRSANLTAGETDTRTYNLVGTDVGPFNDRRIRLAATSNFVLRNRTQ